MKRKNTKREVFACNVKGLARRGLSASEFASLSSVSRLVALVSPHKQLHCFALVSPLSSNSSWASAGSCTKLHPTPNERWSRWPAGKQSGAAEDWSTVFTGVSGNQHLNQSEYWITFIWFRWVSHIFVFVVNNNIFMARNTLIFSVWSSSSLRNTTLFEETAKDIMELI